MPAAWAIATGHLIVGMLILIGSALPDLFDGSLAKASGRASRRGAFFDSVGDRVSDSLILGGMAWYAQDRFGHHAALVPLAVLGASQLVSYIRRRTPWASTPRGPHGTGERVFVLCAALQFPADMLWLLWLVFALSCVTAIQRFVKVWRQAEKPPAPLPVEPTAVVLRWRAWEQERITRDAMWWARSARGSSVPASGGFFAGSRRPGGAGGPGSGAAGGRWHERRMARRQRFDGPGSSTGGTSSGAGAGGAGEEAPGTTAYGPFPGLSWPGAGRLQ